MSGEGVQTYRGVTADTDGVVEDELLKRAIHRGGGVGVGWGGNAGREWGDAGEGSVRALVE